MTPDWATTSSLATGGGTLVLAIATFASVRSANRAARTAERSLQAGLRPVLFASRTQDPTQEIRWGDDHRAHLDGGRATLEEADGIIYLAMSLRNVGAGIAVIHGWSVSEEAPNSSIERPDPGRFHPQTRDLYVPAGDVSFWQAAIRDPDHAGRATVTKGMADGGLFIDLLYGDHEGGQRAITRFVATASGDAAKPAWLSSAVRHWNIDRKDPR